MENYKPCKFCKRPIRWERTRTGKLMPISLRTGNPHWGECQDAQVAQAKRKEQRAGLTAAERERLNIGKHKPDEPGQLQLFPEEVS